MTHSSPEQGDDARVLESSVQPAVSRRFFLKSSGAAIASAGAAGTDLMHASAQSATPADATPMAMAMTATGTPTIEFFSVHEAETVDALTARILPGTPDDPGAREAGVVYHIDRALGGANAGYSFKTYTQGPYLEVSEESTPLEAISRTNLYQTIEVPSDTSSRYGYQSLLTPQELYRRGLISVDAYAQSQFEKDYVDLDEGQQDSVLEDMEADKATGFDAPSGSAFFSRLRNDTIEGMFSDPMYGGNRDLVGWKLIGFPGARGFYTADEMANGDFTSPPMSLADMLEQAGH